MFPDRTNLEFMLANVDAFVGDAVKTPPIKDDFRPNLRASVRLLKVVASQGDQDWVRGQLEEMLARHGLKDFEL